MQTPSSSFVAGPLLAARPVPSSSSVPGPLLANAAPSMAHLSSSSNPFVPGPLRATIRPSFPHPVPLQAKPEPQPDPPLDPPDDGFESESDDEDPNVFKIRDPLQEPIYQRFTTEELHRLIHESEIDLNPPYQRDVVWSDPKQIGLIDSILRNFYVPPVVFAVQFDEDGEEIRICVDGKQRLTSIQKFMDGQIPHKDTKTKKTFWYTVPDNLMKQRHMLPENAKRTFASKKITCMEYRGLTPGMERDIFQRVQMGVTLTMAEKLQAISSPWADWITQLESKHVAVEGGLTAVLDWDTKRGRDFQNIAYIVCCCDGLPTVEQIPTNPKMEKWLSRVDPPTQSFKAEMEQVLRDFWNIAEDSELNPGLDNGKRLAPVEFIFIGVMLYVLRKRSLEERAVAITHLRHAVRSEFRDIRTNSAVAKFLWGVIRKLERGDVLHRVGENTRGKKRKKPDLEEDGEYRPTPISSLGKTVRTRSKKV